MLSICLWLLFSFSVSAQGNEPDNNTGHQIALAISPGGNFSYSQQQLDQAFSDGIRLLEIYDTSVEDLFSVESFNILFNTDIRFLTARQLEKDRSRLSNEILQLYRDAESAFPGKIAALGVFNYADEEEPRFGLHAASLADTLLTQIDKPLYYNSAFEIPREFPSNFNFVSARVPARTALHTSAVYPVTRFQPSGSSRTSLQVLQHLLNRSLESENSLIILPAEWYFQQVESLPEIRTVFASYFDEEPVRFPLPAQKTSSPDPNWPVILLFLIWAGFLLLFRLQPFYADSLFRFFFSHSFFVSDIMGNRIRSGTTGLILMLQHLFITGLLFYTAARAVLSDLGVQALSYHFPYLFITGYEIASFFAAGILLALLYQCIAVIWIYYLNKKINFLSQVLVLYSWPFHINLLLVSLLVVLTQYNSSVSFVWIIGGFFFFTWFLCFNLTAVQTARYLHRLKPLNLLLTVGLHTLAAVMLLLFLLYYPGIRDPLLLALSLP